MLWAVREVAAQPPQPAAHSLNEPENGSDEWQVTSPDPLPTRRPRRLTCRQAEATAEVRQPDSVVSPGRFERPPAWFTSHLEVQQDLQMCLHILDPCERAGRGFEFKGAGRLAGLRQALQEVAVEGNADIVAAQELAVVALFGVPFDPLQVDRAVEVGRIGGVALDRGAETVVQHQHGLVAFVHRGDRHHTTSRTGTGQHLGLQKTPVPTTVVSKRDGEHRDHRNIERWFVAAPDSHADQNVLVGPQPDRQHRPDAKFVGQLLADLALRFTRPRFTEGATFEPAERRRISRGQIP